MHQFSFLQTNFLMGENGASFYYAKISTSLQKQKKFAFTFTGSNECIVRLKPTIQVFIYPLKSSCGFTLKVVTFVYFIHLRGTQGCQMITFQNDWKRHQQKD